MQSFTGDSWSWEALTTEFLLCSKTDAFSENLLSHALALLSSRKVVAIVVTGFTHAAVPIPTSAAAVLSYKMAAATSVVAGAAADILAAAVVLLQLQLS